MSDILYPLPDLCAAAGRQLPRYEIVEPSELSTGAHRLLVHSGDMTSKLEEFFSDSMHLRVLSRQHTAEFYRREVLLYCASNGVPVEYGAIEISLSAFEEPLRTMIVEAKLPLGGLLNSHGFRYRSEPRAFLRFEPCPHLAELFGLAVPETLFGRSNRLLSSEGTELARIVEVLRPV